MEEQQQPASRSVVSMLLRELGDFSLHPQGRPCGRPPARQRHDAHRGTGLTHTAPQYSHSMAIPALTHRSFWTRLVVFGVNVLLYAWVVRLMTQEHSIIGTVLFSLLTLASVAGLIATIMRRPR